MPIPTGLRRLRLARLCGIVACALAATPGVMAQDSPVVSLDEAIASARRLAPAAQAAARRAQGARQAAAAVTWLTNPSIEARVENWGAGTRENLTKDVFLVATQPIELGKRASHRRTAAAATADVADADRALTTQDVVMAVVRGYLAAARARDEVTLLEDQAGRLERAAATMRARVTEGVAAEGDLRRLESEATRLGISLERRLAEREQAIAALGLLIGRPLAAAQLQVPPLAPAPLAANDDTVVEGHPAVVAARLRLASADALAALEVSNRLPVLLVSGGYKRTSGVSTGVAALGITLPVFDRNQAARYRAEGDAAAARLEYEAIKAAIRTELTVLRSTAERLARAAARLEASLLEPARISRDAAYAAVLEGAADVVKLVDADRAYADARLDALSLVADAVMAQRRLALMTGSE